MFFDKRITHSMTFIKASFTVSLGVGQMDSCPSNLVRNPYLKTFGKKCYQFNDYEISWSRAEDRCSSFGGSLVQIKTSRIQQFLMDSLQSLEWERGKVWIGAHETNNMYNEDPTWEWIDGNKIFIKEI